MEYKRINEIKEYALVLKKQSGSIKAYKTGCVRARLGNPGEIITTVSGNEVETVNVVRDHQTNPDWVLTKDGSNTSWIVSDKYFRANYVPVKDDLFKPVPILREFVKTEEDICFLAPWGNEEKLQKGGYLCISNTDRIYGIQKEDFINTYVTESVVH